MTYENPPRIHFLDSDSTDSGHSIINNLPPNTFGRLINRPNVSERIISALNEDNYIILVYGQGGIGKSALVYNIVTGIVDKRIQLNRPIDKIFWFSDFYNHCQLDIHYILSSIKAVCKIGISTHTQPSLELDYIDIRNEFSDSKGSIIVIDNLENIQDLRIWDFILKEGPRKCTYILTSKYDVSYYQTNILNKKPYCRELDSCVTSINVPKVTYQEWEAAFEQKRKDIPRLNSWSHSIGPNHLKQVLDDIYSLMGGNIDVMTRVISILAKMNLVYTDLENEKIKELILKLSFENSAYDAWGLLSNDAQKVLVSAVFNGPTKLDFKTIYSYCRIADIDVEKGKATPGSKLDNSIIECIDLNLIDLDYENGETFYYVVPSIYHFIIYKLKNHELDSFEAIINRWIFSYVSLAQTIGFCYNDPRRMIQLDDPVKRDALLFVLQYCFNNQEYWEDFITISRNLRYYFYTRAIWTEGNECIHIKRANLAKKIGDHREEFDALTYYINIAAKYHELDTVREYIERADAILKKTTITAESVFRFQHAKGLYLYSGGKYDKALEIWNTILKDETVTDDFHDKDAAERWRLKCQLMLNANNPEYISSKIIPDCEILLERAKNRNMERSLIDYTLLIADSYIILEQYSLAESYLDSIESTTKDLNDLLYTARFYLYKAMCLKDETQGSDYIKIATNNFISLKIRHELEYLKSKVDKNPTYKSIVIEMINMNEET